jgi:hypothetical protein
VQLVRTKYEDLSITADVLDSMITVGFFASVITGAAAISSAVRPPARMSMLSLVIASWIRRLPVSGDDVSSFKTSSTRLPATVSPCWFM